LWGTVTLSGFFFFFSPRRFFGLFFCSPAPGWYRGCFGGGGGGELLKVCLHIFVRKLSV